MSPTANMARGLDCGCAQGMLSSRFCAHLSVLTLSHTQIHRKFNKLRIPIHTNICHFIIHKERITYYVHILYVGMHKHTLLNHPPQGIWVMKSKKRHYTISPQSLKTKENSGECIWKEKNICHFHEHSHSIADLRNLKISAEVPK